MDLASIEVLVAQCIADVMDNFEATRNIGSGGGTGGDSSQGEN